MLLQSPKRLPLLAAAALLYFTGVRPRSTEERLEVKITAIGQRNCRAGSNESELPVVRLTLRLAATNRTSKSLIVSKSIGAAWYGEIVARDEEALAAGTYESNPNIDWEAADEKAPPTDAPSTEFDILRPGESFEKKTIIYLSDATGWLARSGRTAQARKSCAPA